MRRVVVLAVLLAGMWGVRELKMGGVGAHDPLLLAAVGFVLLAAYTVSEVGNALKLPRVTGYILTGVALGPSVANILSSQVVVEMRMFNTLALGLIASAAGLELDLAQIRKVWRTLFATVGAKLVLAVPLVAGVVLAARAALAPLHLSGSAQLTALAVVLGVLSIGTSPAIVLAVLKETGAKGRMADLVLGAAVLKDIVVVVMLALAVSVSRMMLAPGTALDVSVLWMVLQEVGSSIGGGALLGVLLILYLKYIRAEMLLFVAAMILVVSELGRALHLELLLVFIAAGFVVRNFSRHEHDLFEPLSLVSLPVFVVFFTNAGAGVDLRNTWKILPVAAAVCAARALAYYVSSRIGGAVGGEPEVVRRNAWLGYLPQAGVTLSLVGIAAQQLPELQSQILTMGMAIVAINLFVGPITVRHAFGLPIPAADGPRVLAPRSQSSAAAPSIPPPATERQSLVPLDDMLASITDAGLRTAVTELWRGMRGKCRDFTEEVIGRWGSTFGSEAAGCLLDPRPVEANAAFLTWIKKPHHADAVAWGGSCEALLGGLRGLVAAMPEVMIAEIDRKHRDPQPGDPARVRLLKRLVIALRFLRFRDGHPMRRIHVRHIARVVVEPHVAELASRTYAAWCRGAASVFETQRKYAAGLAPGAEVAAALRADIEAAMDGIRQDVDATLAKAVHDLCDALERVGTPVLSPRDLRYSKVEPRIHRALRRLQEDQGVWAAKLDAARSACRVAADLARIQTALRQALESHLLASADRASQGVSPVIQQVRERIEAVQQAVVAEPFPEGQALHALEECCHLAFAEEAERRLDRAASQFRPAVTIHNVAVALRELVPGLPDKVPVNRPGQPLHLARSPREVPTRVVHLRELAGQKLLRDLLPFVDERADESSARLAGAASRIREAVDMVHEAVAARRELVDADDDDNALVRQTVDRSIARLDELRSQLTEGVANLRGDLEAATARAFAELRQTATGEGDGAARAESEAAGTRAWRAVVELATPMRRRWERSAHRAGESWTRLRGSQLSHELRVRYRGAALTAAELGTMTRAWQQVREVPDAYARLFTADAVREPRRFTANRAQLARLLEAERTWLDQGPSGVLVVGDYGSGKTSLLNMCELDVRAPRVIRPQRWRVPREGCFAAAMAFELGCRPRDRDIIAHLRDSRTTVLLDDLEHWMTPDVEGLRQFEHVLDLMVRTRHHAFWVATVSSLALRLLEEMAPIRPVFGHVVDLEALDVYALAQAVEARHALSGLRIHYPTHAFSRALNRFGATSDRMMFFRTLRRVSGGNLSRAMASWVRCVAVEQEGGVRPRLHRVMSLGFGSLGKLGPHETAILAQVLRFGPLQPVELARHLQIAQPEVDRYLAFLEAAGLLYQGAGAHGELGIPPVISVPLQQALAAAGVVR